MTSSIILSVTMFLYGIAAFLYLFSWIFKNITAGRLATAAAWISVIANSAGIALRWIESYRLGIGHAPLSNFYESLVFFTWVIAIIYLVLEYQYKNRIIGAFVTPIAFLAIAYASLSPNINDRIQPLIPALKSNWLIAHVITCFIGYAAFAVA
ncbi:MAG: cytochrome c biogenesis protein CcsA, partial [Deltaproteobacteria bacterium]|nr:cytochrome c biogenesis protein CcsA [Deltaproteobacteria bacterium]